MSNVLIYYQSIARHVIYNKCDKNMENKLLTALTPLTNYSSE